MADLTVPRHDDSPQEPSYTATHIFYDDALLAIRNLCERLPDRVDPKDTRIWTETINSIYAIVTDAIERRDGGEA